MTYSFVVLTLVAATALGAQATKPNLLSPPSRPSPVGRISFDWVDSSRATDLDASDAAGYLPYLADFRVAMDDSIARRRFAPEYAAIAAGTLRTHATESAPLHCLAAGCALLILSHGGGVDRSLYSAQYEDLASHGFVVAAIAHSGDTHRVVFPGGRSVAATAARATGMAITPDVAAWVQRVRRQGQPRTAVTRERSSTKRFAALTTRRSTSLARATRAS